MAARLSNVHDQFCKKSLQNVTVAKDFFKANLPKKVLKKIDLDTLQLQSEHFIDAKLKASISDIVYQVKTKDGDGYLSILIEHQRTPDPMMAFRLLHYSVSIMHKHIQQGHKKIPLVYPVVIYQGKVSPYPYSRDLFDLFEDPSFAKEMLFQPFHLIDLKQLSDEIIRSFGSAALMALIQKHIDDGDIVGALTVLAQWDLFKQLNTAPFADYLRAMLEYLYQTAHTREDRVETLETMLITQLPNEKDNIMKLSTHLKNIGREEGLQKGLQKGRQEGIHQRDISIVNRMVNMGLPDDEIQKYTDISLELIRDIRRKTVK